VSGLKKTAVACGCVLIALIMMLLISPQAWAADSSGGWRPIFDLVMRWVNFLILAFVLIKFSRMPIKKFFAGKKEEIAQEIDELEATKNRMLEQIDERRTQIENSRERLEQLKKTIVSQGEKNKLKIIADAEGEGKILLASAQKKIESRISDAREAIKAELVDDAIALAMQKLPEEITEQDNQKFIDAFLKGAASA
jgi:F-type H+-transporting ATPase subunit b